MTAAHALIAAAVAMQKTHVVISTYADGQVKRHETRSLSTAENFAIGERRKINCDLINRDTGFPTRIVSVEVKPL